MFSDWFLIHVRFNFYTVAPPLASTPLPGTEHDNKKGNQETKVQEVPGNQIRPFLLSRLNAVAIGPISLKDAAVLWFHLAVFTGAGSTAGFWRDDPQVWR